MQEQELKDLISSIKEQKAERQNVELKSAEKGFPGKIYDTLSSFSNQDDGGIIIFGIQEKPEFHVAGVYNAAEVQQKIMEASQQMEPKVRPLITIATVNGRTVVSAEIPGADISQRPVYYKGTGIVKGSFIRVGDGDLPMTAYEIYAYEAFRKRIRDDLRQVDEADRRLFNQDRLARYLASVKEDRKNLAENVTDEEILELMGVTSGGVPTISGVMTFSLYPQAYFPQLCITAVSVPGVAVGDQTPDGVRFLDNKRITGAIPEMLDEAVEFVRKNSRTMTVIDENGKRKDRPEYPPRAVREAVLNALIHRDYSQYTENTPVSIEMYQDRMAVRSPGVLFGRATVDMLGKSRPEPRNVALINILELLSVAENRYSGIPTMYHDLREQGMPDPEFEIQRGDFVVTFRNVIIPIGEPADKRDMVSAILAYCRTPRSRKELIDFSGLSQYYLMKKYVTPMLTDGRLKRTLPDKPKSSKQKFVSYSG